MNAFADLPPTDFRQMLALLKSESGLNGQKLAKMIGISPAYLSDLEAGNRRPSVTVVQKLCELPTEGEMRLFWHRAAARACGWEV